LATLFKTAESFVHLDLDGDSERCVAASMVHASGLFMMLACIRFGAPFVLLERFDPETLLDAIKVHRCTYVCGLPFMFVALLQRQLAHPRKVDSLRTCLAVETFVHRNCKSSFHPFLEFLYVHFGLRQRPVDL
jgi:long-chain acyl-CoA synthetase